MVGKQSMSSIWKIWLNAWAAAVVIFGVVLAGGGLDATDQPVELLLTVLGGGAAPEWTPDLRFSVALMGAVSIGWGVTFAAAFDAAHRLGDAAAPVWRMITLAVIVWFVIDGGLSVATGFALNVAPNTVLLAGYLVPVLATGALRNGPG
jgi:hypothetical protein